MDASCWSSLETALTLFPRLVVTVTADTLSLVVLGSCAVSGLCATICCCSVLCCFAALPSAMSSATSRFGAAGSGVLLLRVVGDAAIGTSVIAGVGVSGCPAETGSSSGCCVCVFCCGCCLLLRACALCRLDDKASLCWCCHRCGVDDVHHLFAVLVWRCLSPDCPCFNNLFGYTQEVFVC